MGLQIHAEGMLASDAFITIITVVLIREFEGMPMTFGAVLFSSRSSWLNSERIGILKIDPFNQV